MRARTVLAVSFAVLSIVAVAGCKHGAKKADTKEAAKAVEAKPADPGHYGEAEHDGRWYVFGDAKTEESFAKNHHMPYVRTFIAQGPGGATVVFEDNPKIPDMAPRLVQTFSLRHNLNLQN